MKTAHHWLSLLALSGGVLAPLAAPLAAQVPVQGGDPGFGFVPDEKVTLSASFEPEAARAGEVVDLVVEVEVVPGWHAYGKLETTNIPVTLPAAKLKLGGLEAVGDAAIPDGERKEVFGLVQFPLPESFEVRQRVRVPAGHAAGEVEVAGELGYQICDATSCEPPTTKVFRCKLTIEAGDVRAEYSGAPKTTKPGLKLIPDKLFPDNGDDKFDLKARFEPATARRGETVELVLDAEVVAGWHAYGRLETTNVPVSLPVGQLQLGGLVAVGEAEIPDGEMKEVFGLTQYPLPESFTVRQKLRVPDDAALGEITVGGEFGYQICDANSCEPPTTTGFAATLTVEEGAARAPAATTGGGNTANRGASGGSQDTNGAPKQEPFGGLWGLILACIGGGLFALAMPCTYPMIPITFSFFTKQAEKRGGNVLSLALIYGAGIVTIFVLVGVVVSTAIIPIVNHWLTNLTIGLVFLFFAFVLFGWINFQPPRFVQNLATKAGQTGGLVGVFFMGATLVISSFTCTAPIVGSLIAKVAEFGQLRVGFGMGVFGLTMAIPFVLLALMPTKVKAMPRSGEWMDTLKVSLGFVELAAVLKFVSMVDLALGWGFMNRELFLLMTAAILMLWAAFLFGFLRKAGEPYAGVGAGRQAIGMFVVLVAVYLLSGAMGYRLDKYMTSFAPPYSAELVIARGGDGGESKHHTIVYDSQAKALEAARDQDKLLLYNFTGFN